jgi:hypothetical protein
MILNKKERYELAIKSEKAKKVLILNTLIVEYNATNIEKISKLNSCTSCINSLLNFKKFKDWIYDI